MWGQNMVSWPATVSQRHLEVLEGMRNLISKIAEAMTRVCDGFNVIFITMVVVGFIG